MIKYLKDKNSRRRGVAIELAIFVIMLCFGLSVILVTTSMIQKNNYNRMVYETTERLDINRIGAEFCSAVKKNDLAYFEWKLQQETEYFDTNKYSCVIINSDDVKSLKISTLDEEVILYVEINNLNEIVVWEYKIAKVSKVEKE